MNNLPLAKPVHDKPVAFGIGIEYPYNLLPTGQQFERLLYHIFKVRIEKETGFSSRFDRALLMPGGSEQGRDVMLTLNGVPAGLIQCKKVIGRLSDTDCAKEVIKFVLHTIQDNSLMPDATRFVYYLAVSSGLTVLATNLIATSKTSLPAHDKLKKWTEAVIKENKKLCSFTYAEIVQPLMNALKGLQIEPIFSTDLDSWLSQYPEIVPTFFRGGATQEITPLTSFASPISHGLILDRFRSASVSLQNCPSTFTGLPQSHVQRPVVHELFGWLTELDSNTTDIAQENIRVGVLVDDAGYGKTTVMKDLYDRLQTVGVPTLALKADMLPFSQRSSLTNELQLMDDPERLVSTLCEDYDRVIVLIDQLDALSQHQSADRRPLRVFNQLINQLAIYPQVRLLIACRRFDLQYDPTLASIKHKFERNVGPLTREEVEGIFIQLGLSPDYLTTSLYDLLRVPQHINVFCQVHQSLTDFTTLQSVQDLYRELWQQKLVNLPNVKNGSGTLIRQCVKQLAMDMHTRQQIVLSYVRYEDQFSEALNYLQSEGVVIIEKQTIRFFHQSFFDYVFARAFVDQGGQLCVQIVGEEGKTKHQGLFIRSQVRQVLSYLREADEQVYITELESFLTRLDVRYHLKLLIIQALAFQPVPTMPEKQLVRRVISADSELWTLFLESVASPAWFVFLLALPTFQADQHQEDSIVHQQLHALCWRVQKQDMNLVINFLQTLPNDPAWDQFILRLLYSGPAFTDATALRLFDRVESRNKVEDIWYFRVVDRSISTDPEWASHKILHRIKHEQLKLPFNKKDHIPVDPHSFIRVMDKLYEQNPDLAIRMTLTIIRQLIADSRFPEEYDPGPNLFNDWSFCQYTPGDSRDSYAHYKLNSRIREWLRKVVTTQLDEPVPLVLELLAQPSVTLIKIGLDAIQAAPATYITSFYNRLIQDGFLVQMNAISYLPYNVAETLRQTYEFFSSEQQQRFVEKLLAMRVPSEQEIIINLDRKYYRKKVGLAQYQLMIVLPDEAIHHFPELRGRYLELARKFDEYEHKTPKRRSGTVRRAVLSDNAYASMTIPQWLDSLAAYDARKGSFEERWDQVSEHSHAQRFTDEVTKRPEYFVPMLQTLLTRSDLPDVYMYNGIDGLIKAHYDPSVVKSLIKRCIPLITDEMYLMYMIRFTDYLIDTAVIDEDIFAFIQRIALSEADNETVEDEALSAGINHPVGAATGRLIHFAHFTPYVERVFITFERLALTASISTRAVMLHQLHVLKRHDEQRTLRLFIQLTDDFDPSLVFPAFDSVNRLMFTNFTALSSFFKRALSSTLSADAADGLGQLLAVAYVCEFAGSEDLVDEVDQVLKEEIVKGIIYVAMQVLTENDTTQRQRAYELAKRYLRCDNKGVADSYRRAFYQYQMPHFPLLLEFLRQYVQSAAGRLREGAFYDYLLKCVREYPDECIELASSFDTHEGPDMHERDLDYQPVEVVMQAYNAFIDYRRPSQSLEAAMDLFDRIMKQPLYRSEVQVRITDLV